MDINNDKYLDIVSGNYLGRIIVYYGSEKGFLPQVDLEQKSELANRSIQHDFFYANSTFADYNGDGLMDAFVVGYSGVNVMINEGSKEKPVYGLRQPLLHLDGNPIHIRDLTKDEKEMAIRRKRKPDFSEAKSSTVFVDWDKDGVGDLLVATTNRFTTVPLVLFFKGVKSSDGIRFEKGIGLFATEDGTLAIRGKNLYIWVGDYNEDGISDLMLGTTFVYSEEAKLFDTPSNKGEIDRLKKQNKKTRNIGCVILMLGEGNF